MKKIFLPILCALAVNAFASEPLTPLLHQKEFADYWMLVEESDGEKESFQEWIPSSEAADKWSKSFGIQRYQLERGYDLEHFYNLFIETLSKDFENNKEVLHYEILSQDERNLVFTWWCEDQDYEIGREWVHLVKEDNYCVLFLRFATKEKEVSPSDETWRECVTKAANSTL